MKKRLAFELILSLLCLCGLSLGLMSPASASSPKTEMTPTIYVSGSSGKVDQVDWLIKGIKKDKSVKASKTLIFSFNRLENRFTINGEMPPTEKAPMIEFAVGNPRTSDPKPYSEALKILMHYLMEHYKISEINFVGYSSGATGVINYMMETSKDKTYPPVANFISLDGEYNSCKYGYKKQELSHILSSAPDKKTAMYQYIEANYQKLDPKTKIFLMEGNNSTKPGQLTDGTIPWGDSFSIYHLLQKNGNPVSIYLYPTKVSHSVLPKEKTVQTYIKNLLY